MNTYEHNTIYVYIYYIYYIYIIYIIYVDNMYALNGSLRIHRLKLSWMLDQKTTAVHICICTYYIYYILYT